MKKRYFLLLFLASLVGLACVFWVMHLQHRTRADYYISLYYLENITEWTEVKSYSMLMYLEKTAERVPNLPQKDSLIKEGEVLRDATRKATQELYHIAHQDTNLYAYCQILEYEQVIKLLEKYEQNIKNKYPYALSVLGNLTDKVYLNTQSVAEARFVVEDLRNRLLMCERTVLDKLITAFEPKNQSFAIVPFIQTNKKTYYEGDTYKGFVYILSPVRFGKGEAKATVNGKAVTVGKDGIARFDLPADNPVWEGTFSCKMWGRDTTFHAKDTF